MKAWLPASVYNDYQRYKLAVKHGEQQFNHVDGFQEGISLVYSLDKEAIEAAALTELGGWALDRVFGIASAAEIEATTATNALIRQTLKFSAHSLLRLAERGVTEEMAEYAITNGKKFYDPVTNTVNYVLREGFASGKSLLVGTNPLTGEVTTVIRSSKNLVNARFIPIN